MCSLPTHNEIFSQNFSQFKRPHLSNHSLIENMHAQQNIMQNLNKIYCKISKKYITNLSSHLRTPKCQSWLTFVAFQCWYIALIITHIRIKGVKCSRGKRFKLNCILKSTNRIASNGAPSIRRKPLMILETAIHYFGASTQLDIVQPVKNSNGDYGPGLLNDLIWDLLMKVSASQMGCITLRLQARAPKKPLLYHLPTEGLCT